MSVPRNVLWFEVLLYISLMLDALSVAVSDRTPSFDMTEDMITAQTVLNGAIILLLVLVFRPKGLFGMAEPDLLGWIGRALGREPTHSGSKRQREV